MITATAWVPRGCAAQFRSKFAFEQEEYDRIAGLAKLHLDDAKEELEEAQEAENGSEAPSRHENGTSRLVTDVKSTASVFPILRQLAPLRFTYNPTVNSTMISRSTI